MSQQEKNSASLEQARQHLHAGRLKEADGICRGVLEREPTRAEAWYLLGIIRQNMGDFQQAAHGFVQAGKHGQESLALLNNLGVALKKGGNLKGAGQVYRKALAMDPDHPGIHTNMGNLLRQLRQPKKALVHYRKALQSNSNSAEGWRNLARILAELGELGRAEESVRKALVIRPDYPDAHRLLKRLLVGQRDPQRAEPAPRAIEKQPSDKSDQNDRKDAEKPRPRRVPGRVKKRLKRASLALSRGDVDGASSLLQRGLQRDPAEPLLLERLGVIEYQRRRYEPALQAFEKALEKDPDNDELHTNLGVVKRRCGDLLGAIVSYKQALDINPDNVISWNNLGNAHADQAQLDEAEASFLNAIKVRKEYPDAHRNLGDILRRKRRFRDAHRHARQALKLKPDDITAKLLQVTIFRDSGQFKEALKRCRELLGEHPRAAEAHLAMGRLLKGMGDSDRAEASLRRVIRLNPHIAKAYVQLSSLLHEQGQHEEALTIAHQGAEQVPTDALVFRHLGALYKQDNRLEEAKTAFREAIRLAPQESGTHMELAFVLIHNGELEQGGEEYEWRTMEGRLARKFKAPKWDGSDPRGKRILVYCEQGQGANIHYARYIPLLAERGARIILECYPSLKGVFSSLEGLEKLVVRGESIPEHDCYASMLSMLHLFGSSLETLPVNIPYLHSDEHKLARWSKEFKAEKRPVVGLVWQGNPGFAGDRSRSMPVKHFFPMIEAHPNIRFIALQWGFGREQLVDLPENLSLEDFGGQLDDFSDTMALIEQLDLVISTDTSVPHIAGALGREVWLLLAFHGDWRYMLDRGDTPWYPSMRIFRQPEREDWAGVVAQVSGRLVTEFMGEDASF
ncbi:MAG: tetratricopeptide repeat protein [Magnetococcales bacterium]|nr:tetratricopeptide repeat protein [Magnetococcales bacterium]